jgi:hypothetical protein
MNKFIFSILLSGLFACNQKTETVDKTNYSATKDTSKLYSIAIEEYLKAVSQKNKPDIDSLFVGQYDDLKNIKLPEAILNTKIILLTSYDEGTKKLIYRKSFDFVNIAPHNPLVSKTQAEFIFIRFLTEKSNGKVSSWPIHNCFINISYDFKQNHFALEKIYFEYPYSNNYTEKQ